jgi:ABC-2 type transport system permease protein
MTVVRSGETTQRRRAHQADSPLMFRHLRFLGRERWGAVTAKELRYVAREPRRKVTLVNSVIIGVVFPLWVALRSTGDARSRAVLLATLAGYVAVLASSNQFGFDGAAAWVDVMAGDTMRPVLIGKNMAIVLQVMPVVVVVGTVVAALTGGWAFLPGALVFALAGLGAGLGIADNVSVRYPVRLPESRSPFASNATGQGCTTSVILMGCALLQNVILLPIVVAGLVVAVLGPGWLLLVAPLSAIYGAALWWGGLVLADRWGSARRPEILALVDPARG